MTASQERAISLALNVLHVGFFECPKHYYEYFISNDEWALLMTAGGMNDVGAPPQELALSVLRNAIARVGLFAKMTDFRPPAHHCSFLRERIKAGEQSVALEPCRECEQRCPYATFEQLEKSK